MRIPFRSAIEHLGWAPQPTMTSGERDRARFLPSDFVVRHEDYELRLADITSVRDAGG